jgi:hypothetical protein
MELPRQGKRAGGLREGFQLAPPDGADWPPGGAHGIVSKIVGFGFPLIL